MLVPIVPIGNSKGIRIPKSLLSQLDIEEQVDMEVREGGILLKPVSRKPREGWAQAFAAMRDAGEDELLLPEGMDGGSFEWLW